MARESRKSEAFSRAKNENLFEVNKSFALLLASSCRTFLGNINYCFSNCFEKQLWFSDKVWIILFLVLFSFFKKFTWSVNDVAQSLFYYFLLRCSCMSCIAFFITKNCSNTDDFNALISVDRDRSFSIRSWIRLVCSSIRFTLGVSTSNNGIDCGSSA